MLYIFAQIRYDEYMLKPIEEEHTSVTTTRMWVKVVFLLIIVAGSVFFFSTAAEKGRQKAQSSAKIAQKKAISPTMVQEKEMDENSSLDSIDGSEEVSETDGATETESPVNQSETTVESADQESSEKTMIKKESASDDPEATPTKHYTLDEAKEETIKLANDTVEKAKDAAGGVLGEVAQKVASEVGKQVEQTASDSAQIVVDFAYRQTVLEIIKRLVESLPGRQQTEFEEMICK